MPGCGPLCVPPRGEDRARSRAPVPTQRGGCETIGIAPLPFALAALFLLPLPRLSMSLALTFAALRSAKPAAKAIVWPRMDQKSCLKAIVAAGFTPIVVENLVEVCATQPNHFSATTPPRVLYGVRSCT